MAAIGGAVHEAADETFDDRGVMKEDRAGDFE